MIDITNADSGSVQPALLQTSCWLSGRLTIKKLIKWCNDQFAKLEITDYEVFEIYRTNFNQNDYECGACRLVIRFKNKTMKEGDYCSVGTFYCFYKISELEEYLKTGHDLYLKDNGQYGLLSNLEIEVRKR